MREQLSKVGIRQRTDHDSFLWMMNASIQEVTNFDIERVLGYWFFYAFGQAIQEEDFNENLIDKIREKLLRSSGVTKPILTETTLSKRVKESIEFED